MFGSIRIIKLQETLAFFNGDNHLMPQDTSGVTLN